MRRTSRLAAFAAATTTAVAVTLYGGTATAAVAVNSSQLRTAVTSQGIMAHLEALQAIADANGGTRASGTAGYAASVAYVSRLLAAAGYGVTIQEFDYDQFVENSPATFSRTDVDPDTLYVLGTDYVTMEYSGSGSVAAAKVVPTNDIVIPPGATANTSSSGCEASDFAPASTTEDQVTLVQRGTCTFAVKAQNAEAAGYDAVIVFNEGQEGRKDVLSGTLGASVGIPVIGTTYALGETLYSAIQAQAAVRVSITTDTQIVTTSTQNVIADSRVGRTDRTVLVGAHLDSVPEGPGINDNGSGSATILELALQVAKSNITLKNQVRFAFWGAEESGLIGSEYYVSQLTPRGIKNIAVNLNFDMLGSPNYGRLVYDGDGSASPVAGPNGSGNVEDVFTDYFDSQGLASEPTEFSGRSDYGPFIAVGIPAGGLFSGAEGIKTTNQVALYGGVAGVAYDPCYHLSCDSLEQTGTTGYDATVYAALASAYPGDLVGNVNTHAIDEMSDAAAHAVLTFAMTTSAVNGTATASRKAAAATEFKGPLRQR